MKTQIGKLLMMGLLLGGLFTSSSFAATVATAALRLDGSCKAIL